MKKIDETTIKKMVKDGYTKIARNEKSCCNHTCCSGTNTNLAEKISKRIGYKENELAALPQGANLGLGCGNPVALASLKEGEIVLDLGSGAGIDCFLAAEKVGKKGRVIGVDMTPEMLARAQKNAQSGNYKNVEFRLGEIEKIPLENNSVNVVISNCVINLSPDKQQVFREVFRVLKKGGRLMVSDLVLSKELPETIKNSVSAYIGCLSGALMKDEYLKAIKKAAFSDIRIVEETNFPIELMANDPAAKTIIEDFDLSEEMLNEISSSVLSIKIQARK